MGETGMRQVAFEDYAWDICRYPVIDMRISPVVMCGYTGDECCIAKCPRIDEVREKVEEYFDKEIPTT